MSSSRGCLAFGQCQTVTVPKTRINGTNPVGVSLAPVSWLTEMGLQLL